MTTFGEFPAEAERVLTNDEIGQFRNNVLWPSVKWLKRDFDYMCEAPVGSRFEVGETFLVGETQASVWLQAEIFPKYCDEDGVSGRIAQVRASTEFIDPEMTDELIKTARSYGVPIDDFDEEQGVLSAWTETEYLIDDTDDPVRVETTYKLKGLYGEELWSDELMGKTDPGLSLCDAEAERLEALQDLLEGEMTADHLEYVRFVLSALGVPEEVVYPELD